MSRRARGAAHAPRTPRITLRSRLTLVNAAVFLVAGVVLLASTYVLFTQHLASREPGFSFSSQQEGDESDGDSPTPPPQNVIVTDDGTVLTDADAETWLENEAATIRQSASTSLLAYGVAALVVVGGAAAAFGWLVAGRVLAPLHRITDTARRIAAAPAADRGLHERIALPGPDDEVRDLAVAFDTMLDRLDRSFDGQRRFVANASHELRTPLTLTRASVEVAMNRRNATADVTSLGETLLEINARHERLISGLLLLAGSENDLGETRRVDVVDVVAHAAAQLEPAARDADVRLRLDAPDPLEPTIVDGDALLLERLAHNLVENGIRHNERGGWVRVAVTRGDDGVRLQVSNSGTEIPSYEVPSLFEPFRRGSGDRIDGRGAGLGLSIVRSIVRSHGGRIDAEAPAAGGLQVTVSLPAAR